MSRPGKSLFWIAVAFVVLATFVHALALPLVVSYDGMEYAHLANVLSGPAVIAHWNFYRTPLFPIALNRAFWLGGEQPQAALLVTVLFGLAGIVVSGLIVRKVAGDRCGAAAVVVLFFYPVLVGYEHMLLSETGIFFWIALLVWSVVCLVPASGGRLIWAACWTALVIALGYYWRPTILYLSPVAASAVLCILLLPAASAAPYREFIARLRNGNGRAFAAALIIALGPWLPAYPWIHLTNKRMPDGYHGFVAQGLYRQVVVPLDDPLLAPVRAEYKAAIEHDSLNGRLPLDGASLGHVELVDKILHLFDGVGVYKLIRKYPLRYIEGAAKTMIFFFGVPDHRVDDENWNFSHAVFDLWPATQTLDRMPGWNPKLVQFTPRPYGGGAFAGRMFDKLLPAYTWVVLAASIASFIWMVFSLKHADAVGLVMTVIPFALLFLHALTLQAADRYPMPVYPLMLANLVVVVRLIWIDLRHKRRASAQRKTDSAAQTCA